MPTNKPFVPVKGMPAETKPQKICGKFGDKGAKPKRIRYKPIAR
ncbi:hypothetical protein [Methylotenera sp.]|nr:hypothetical protein [Methylotenera sp.]MDP3777920.1 hypothetical protein [Methylotenera sp.]